jgi:hypothetical protein
MSKNVMGTFFLYPMGDTIDHQFYLINCYKLIKMLTQIYSNDFGNNAAKILFSE